MNRYINTWIWRNATVCSGATTRRMHNTVKRLYVFPNIGNALMSSVITDFPDPGPQILIFCTSPGQWWSGTTEQQIGLCLFYYSAGVYWHSCAFPNVGLLCNHSFHEIFHPASDKRFILVPVHKADGHDAAEPTCIDYIIGPWHM